MKEQLTQQELQMLINTMAQVSMPVGQVQPYIDIINKMSRMIDQIRQQSIVAKEQGVNQGD